eukprot:3126641-Pyramimonas_sp.AAC.1
MGSGTTSGRIGSGGCSRFEVRDYRHVRRFPAASQPWRAVQQLHPRTFWGCPARPERTAARGPS